MTEEPKEPETPTNETLDTEMVDGEVVWKEISIKKAPAESWIKGVLAALLEWPAGR